MVARWLPMKCGRCEEIVTGETPWVVGHIKSRNSYPELTWEVSNWQPEHRSCSDATGQAAVIEKARREGAESVQNSLFDAAGLRVFPADRGSGKPPLLPVSLPATGEPIETRPELAWSSSAMLEHPWTAAFAEVPGDASPPLYMSPVPADATGSYADEPCECHDQTAIEWIEAAERKTLRWWQKLAVTRQLEHREDGSLCHEEVLESASRRVGKSMRVRGVALWRMEHGERIFGEVQTVMHTGADMAICREIQRGAWRWAEANGWTVTVANGKEAIETPNDDRWMVRAQDSVYGYDVTLAIADECWKVKPDTITEGLEPATLERLSAQVHLTSTAHRRATSLMRAKIKTELTGVDLEPGTLIMVWAAPHGSDPADPEVWRAASAHWTPARLRLITKKYQKALAGEVDPQADDPDPMAGFVAQYLNVWPMGKVDTEKGDALASEHDWLALAMPRPAGPPAAAAIETWFAAGVSVALVWRVGDGPAIAAVTDHLDLADAVAHLGSFGFRGTVTVGASLATGHGHDGKRAAPALKGLRIKPGQARAGAAAGEVSRLIAEDELRHDGGEHLTGQILAARTVPGTEGPRLISHGRADAIKALVWAVRASDSATQVGRAMVILPTRR